MEFLLGSAAAMGACLITNPLDVIKTRMQLQGELKPKGQHTVHFKNLFHAGYVVAKHEGFAALQAGLVPSLWVQLVMNGSRLGVYGVADAKGYLRDENGNIHFTRTLLITGTSAVVGRYMASPLFLVKTQIQAQASDSIAVGHQHNHAGSLQALTRIYKKSGVEGLFRGAHATIPRAFIGGSCQLLLFEYTKQLLTEYRVTTSPLLKSFIGSMVGGLGVTTLMTPFDMIMTRLYNQPVDVNGKGILYNGYSDCARKICKIEGFWALYKGMGAQYFRIGPHAVLVLVFFDQLRSFAHEYYPPESISVQI